MAPSFIAMGGIRGRFRCGCLGRGKGLIGRRALPLNLRCMDSAASKPTFTDAAVGDKRILRPCQISGSWADRIALALAVVGQVMKETGKTSAQFHRQRHVAFRPKFNRIENTAKFFVLLFLLEYT
jgi:hypothetical protein